MACLDLALIKSGTCTFDLIKIGQNMIDPDVIRTRSLLIWSQTRYRCATESCYAFHSNLTRDSNN